MKKNIKLNSRELNLLNALKVRPCTVRELLTLVPTNNPAEYIKRLRNLGFCIYREWAFKTNNSGETIRYGVYHLTGFSEEYKASRNR